MRIGFGWDVHRTMEKSKKEITLGGVTLPFGKMLEGLGDADVLCHATAKAILGALALAQEYPLVPEGAPGEGDVGTVMLAGVASVMRERGFRLGNLDATIEAQFDVFGHYLGAMRRNLAFALGCEEARVGIKTATQQGMGFTGEGLGLTVRCVCLLEER